MHPKGLKDYSDYSIYMIYVQSMDLNKLGQMLGLGVVAFSLKMQFSYGKG